MLYETLEYALRVGCNSSLSAMIKSPLFEEVFAKHAGASTMSLDSAEGIAWRAGHLSMGTLFNTLPEKEALAQAQTQSSDSSLGGTAETRALTECFGHALVLAAEKCLPSNVLALAQEWKISNADAQIEIARQLYFLFRSENQESHGELTIERVYEDWNRRLDDRDDQSRFLPALFGEWNKDTCPANCQGKAQMIAAFARLAGTRSMVVSPLINGHDQEKRAREQIFLEVLEDVVERKLDDADSSFSEGLQAAQIDRHLVHSNDFHIGIALELCDGRWLLLDPHGLSWGMFSDEWQLTKVCQMLEKYRWALPGLQLLCHDHGRAKQVVEEQMALARRLICASQQLGKKTKESDADFLQFIDLIAESEEFDLLMHLDLIERGEGEYPQDINAELRRYFATVLLLGGEDKLWDLSVMFDPEFLPKKIKSWLTFYHATALNLFSNRLTNEGKLVHPVCEFGLPEYHLGISALNSTSFFIPRLQNSSKNQFFLGHSFDQVSLHNALSDPVWGQAALQSLRSLPFVHSLCRRKMECQQRVKNWFPF